MPVDNLLNFNGADGTQVFTDDGSTPAIWLGVNSPALTTSEFKFGTSCLELDGVNQSINTFDIDLSDENTDFTIDGFVRFKDLVEHQFCFQLDSSQQTGLKAYRNTILLMDGSSIYTLINNLVIDRWYHIAICRENGLVTVGVDGYFNTISRMNNIHLNGTEIKIGTWSGITYALNGYMDSVRVIVGQALYNVLSTPDDIPQIEPDVSDVLPVPTPLPTNQKTVPDVFRRLGTPTVYKQGTSVNGSGAEIIITPPVTSTNIISGNVEKLGLPFGANVACVSLGLNAEVVGTGISDLVTGDYSIDIHPHTDEVLIYVAPDYGKTFSATSLVSIGEIVHPTVPNRYVYVCTVGGNLGGTEPNWGTEGLINSGGVTFNTIPLHRPLMNGFIKPVVTPI